MFEKAQKSEQIESNIIKYAKIALFASIFAFEGNPVRAESQTQKQTIESLFKQYNLDSIVQSATIDAYDVPVVSNTGTYILQIDQIHATGMVENDVESVKATIETHKNIEKIITLAITSNNEATICGESIHDVTEKITEWEDEKRDLSNLKFLVEKATLEKDFQKAWEEYEKWSNFFVERSFPGYAQKMRLYGAGTISHLFADSPDDKFKRQLTTENPFGQDIFYYGGALQHMYKSGEIGKDIFFACEDENALSNVGSAIGKLRDAVDRNENADITEVERLMVIREDFIVKNVAKKVNEDGSKLVVMVLGGYHDLSNNIKSFNTQDSDIGYMYLKPHPLGTLDVSIK